MKMLRRAGLLSVLLIVGLCTGAWAELIAYFPFDEGSGTTAADVTGNGNNGTFNGDVEWVAGYKGTAVRFDTAGERIVIGPIDPTANNGAMTLAAWINWEGQGHTISQQGIIGKRLGWTTDGATIKWFWQTNPAGDLLFRADFSGGGTSFGWGNTLLVDYANEWTHVAVTWEGGAAVQYINAEEVSSGNVTFRESANDTPVTIGCVDSTNTETFVGAIDEVRIYDTVLRATEIVMAMQPGAATASSGPVPASGATDVRRDVTLSWTAGELAASHDVYFGMDFADVNSGDASVLVSPGQTATSYAVEELLEFGQTYYWRVDEVNAPPDSTVFPGAVWSFTVETYAYPVENVTATASSATTSKGMTPDKTVDGSGMTGDEHSTDETAMWLTAPLTTLPAWIQYEFDDVYKLSELWVWNSNQSIESFVGFGAKDVTIEYSLDGAEWTKLTDTELARAPGDVGYIANTTVDMTGVLAKFVRLTITSNWGGFMPQVGLSEVRFYHVPVKAGQPSPASGSAGAPLDVTLTWRPGREATSHDVYFSDERSAVEDGTAPMQNVSASRFEPSGLEYGQFYYWKVNEVGDAGSPPVEGDVWSFATTEYMVVDDFESYTDDIEAGTTIWQTWLDGLTNNTGSIVGYFEAPFAERTIVHGGRQSMPMDYNNVNSPFYSEVERTFDPTQDWTANGTTELSLWYHGYPVAFAEDADGSITMSGSGHDIWDEADDFRFAYKRLSGDGSIVARVDGLANTNDWAKAGVMIRESLDDTAKMAYMVVTPANGVSFGWRAFLAVTPEQVNTTGVVAPQYVKLTRKGDVFTAQYSANGSAWQDLTTADGTAVSVSMAGNPLIGLCVTSHDASLVTTAEFSEITSSGTGAWQVVAVGDDPEPGNDADDLYLVVQDSSNKTVVVTNPDPAAVNANEWTEWKIPLSDLAGVNLSRVETIYIGVGDRDNPQPDGAGRIFIDDIRVGRPMQYDTTNLLVNGGFEDGVLEPWSIYGDATGEVVTELVGAAVPEDPAEGTYCLYVDVAAGAADIWNAGLQPQGEVFQGGKKYTVSAFLKAKQGTLEINMKPELAQDPYTGYGDQRVTITDEWAEYHVTTPVFTADVAPAGFTFHIGFAVGGFWVDDVKFYEGDYVPSE
jgi:hypothetical protein